MRCQHSVLFRLMIPPLVPFSVGMPQSSAPINRRCELLAGAKSGSDLTIQGDAAGVAVGGNIRFADRVAVARGVEQLRSTGRSVCTIHRVRSGRGEADPTVAALFKFLGRLHGGESAYVIWGGGGIAVAGWLHDDALVDLRRTAAPRWPLDAGSVGRLDALPTPVATKVEFLTVTSSSFVQFEQFHPRAGHITIETSSAVWLEACPGGWRGETPIDASSWGSTGLPESASRSASEDPQPFLTLGGATCISPSL